MSGQLTIEQVAARVGVKPSTWRTYVARGHAPAPDGRLGATPWWQPSTVDAWAQQRQRSARRLAAADPPVAVRRGYRFVHDRILAPGWTPRAGQGYADGPKAMMVVTRATRHTVWYRYAADPAGRGWRMDRARFEARFGPKAPSPPAQVPSVHAPAVSRLLHNAGHSHGGSFPTRRVHGRWQREYVAGYRVLEAAGPLRKRAVYVGYQSDGEPASPEDVAAALSAYAATLRDAGYATSVVDPQAASPVLRVEWA